MSDLRARLRSRSYAGSIENDVKRPVHRALPSVVSVVALAAVASACGTQTIVKTVTAGQNSTSTVASTGATTGSAATTASSQSAQQATVGGTIKLMGNGGETMNVTVDQVIDPLPVGQFDTPDAGDRFVGVQITLSNVGSVAYSDSPGNGATLLSDTHEQATSQIVSGGPCQSDFASSAHIPPGGTQQGCLGFELPTGQSPGSFQFTLNSGFADQTGQWSLAGAAAPSTSSGGASAAVGIRPCDPNISAGAGTTCPFAENVFRAVAAGYQQSAQIPTNVTATSPVTHKQYSLTCAVDSAQVIKCTDSTGSFVTFSVHSVQVY